MLIQLNTETCKVVAKPHKNDAEITKEELKVRITNLLITAICGNAVTFFDDDESRKKYVMAISVKAIESLGNIKQEIEDGE